MYFLSKDCFVCKMGCYWIVLSARRDQYLCMADQDLASIGHFLHGWKPQESGISRPMGAEAKSLVSSLVANGILTDDSGNGKAFVEEDIQAPEYSILASSRLSPSRRPFLSTPRFFLACVTVDWRLRKESLLSTLDRVERRRRPHEVKSTTHDASHAARLVAAFVSLRPWYPRPYLCLFDSLALLEFLATFHCFPRMVFGVVADPFQAHCWVQGGSVVFNDNLERVGRYKPILSV